MRRRDFLIGSAIAAGSARKTWGQGSDKAKLARIGIMTANFSSLVKDPAHPDDQKRTLELLDLPQVIAKRFGVHYLELERFWIRAESGGRTTSLHYACLTATGLQKYNSPRRRAGITAGTPARGLSLAGWILYFFASFFGVLLKKTNVPLVVPMTMSFMPS
jgi:hypothetical protein